MLYIINRFNPSVGQKASYLPTSCLAGLTVKDTSLPGRSDPVAFAVVTSPTLEASLLTAGGAPRYYRGGRLWINYYLFVI